VLRQEGVSDSFRETVVMDITQIPFNKWLGITRVQDGSDYLLGLAG
jgi:hypothetical protein